MNYFICPHSQLARQCPICDAERDLAALRMGLERVVTYRKCATPGVREGGNG